MQASKTGLEGNQERRGEVYVIKKAVGRWRSVKAAEANLIRP